MGSLLSPLQSHATRLAVNRLSQRFSSGRTNWVGGPEHNNTIWERNRQQKWSSILKKQAWSDQHLEHKTVIIYSNNRKGGSLCNTYAWLTYTLFYNHMFHMHVKLSVLEVRTVLMCCAFKILGCAPNLFSAIFQNVRLCSKKLKTTISHLWTNKLWALWILTVCVLLPRLLDLSLRIQTRAKWKNTGSIFRNLVSQIWCR